MNKKQLIGLGVPEDCIPQAIASVQVAARDKQWEKPTHLIKKLVEAPDLYLSDKYYGELAQAVIEADKTNWINDPIEYHRWGDDLDDNSIRQITNACKLPVSKAAALMPDAHSGYGLPIGGVLGCENAIIPYGVGVDIACRMKMTITDLPVETVAANDSAKCRDLDAALNKGTMFGTGKACKRPYHHQVLDEDWTITAVTREVRDKAVKQLGTSGSGNHFVEWGVVTLNDDSLGVEKLSLIHI